MKKSRANDEASNNKEKPQRRLSSREAIKNPITFIKFLTLTYQSYEYDNGVKYDGPILDNCPACNGLGFIAGANGDGEACPVCLTGRDKHERLDYVQYRDKPECIFQEDCPIKNENQKIEKCNKCICKFDKILQVMPCQTGRMISHPEKLLKS